MRIIIKGNENKVIKFCDVAQSSIIALWNKLFDFDWGKNQNNYTKEYWLLGDSTKWI